MAVNGEGKRIVPVWETFTKKAIKKHEKLFHWNEIDTCIVPDFYTKFKELDEKHKNANNNKWIPKVGEKCWWDGISACFTAKVEAQIVIVVGIQPTTIIDGPHAIVVVELAERLITTFTKLRFVTTYTHLSKLNTCQAHLPRITVITLDKCGEKSEYSFCGEPDYARIRRETIGEGMMAAFVINKETKEAKNFLCDEIWLSSLTARRYTIPFDSVAREIVILQHEIKSHCVHGRPNPKFHINEHVFLSIGDLHEVVKILKNEYSKEKKSWVYKFVLPSGVIHWQPEKYFHKLRYQKDDGSWEEVSE